MSEDATSLHFRYVEWNGFPRLFVDIVDSRGVRRTFRVSIDETEDSETSTRNGP